LFLAATSAASMGVRWKRLIARSFCGIAGLVAVAGCMPSARPATPPPANVRELHVLTSGGFAAAFRALAVKYEAKTGVHIAIAYGPSMGDTAGAIPARLQRGEPADLVILARSSLDRLAASGMVRADSVVDLGLSRIALAVRAGAAAPDISTPDKFRSALLSAKSVAWSDSASGVYIRSVLLNRLGISRQLAVTARTIAAEPVGNVVARGDAELGMQQLSELKPIKGIHIVGLLPESLQQVTPFSAGIVRYSPNQPDARALVSFLKSRDAEPIIRDSGLQPAPSSARATR